MLEFKQGTKGKFFDMVFAEDFKNEGQQLKYAHRLGAGLDMSDEQLLKFLQKTVHPEITWEQMRALRLGYQTKKRTPIQFECFACLSITLGTEAFCLTREVKGKPRRYHITLREYQQIAQKLTSLIWRSRDKVVEVRHSYFIPSREKIPADPFEGLDPDNPEDRQEWNEAKRINKARLKNPASTDGGYKRKTGRGIRDKHKLIYILDNLVAANVFRRFAARGCPTRYAIGRENPFYLLADVPDLPDTPVSDNPYLPPQGKSPATGIFPPPVDLEEVNKMFKVLQDEIDELRAENARLREQVLRSASVRVPQGT